MGEKYNLLPLFNTDESKWPLCKVWWNEITKKNAIDKTDKTLEGQRYWFLNPDRTIPIEAICGGLNVIDDKTRYLVNQSGAVEWNESCSYSKGAVVKKTLDNGNIIFYMSLKDDNTSPLDDKNSWKIDCMRFDWNNWAVNNSQSNIKLSHKGAMKFDAEYLHDGLKLLFIAKKTNTATIDKITIDDVEVGVGDESGVAIAAGGIIANYPVELIYSELLEKFIYFEKSDAVAGEVRARPEGRGWIACNGQLVSKSQYPRLWAIHGVATRKGGDTTSGQCYIGSKAAYIDAEDGLVNGNDYFNSKTPLKTTLKLTNPKTYSVVVENQKYYVDKVNPTHFYTKPESGEEEGQEIVFKNENPQTGATAYNKAMPAIFSSVESRLFLSVNTLGQTYLRDVAEQSNRKFAVGGFTGWLLTNDILENEDGTISSQFYQGTTDPQSILLKKDGDQIKVEEVGESGGVKWLKADTFTYNQDSANLKKWVWNGEQVEESEPVATTIYSEWADVGVNDNLFAAPVNVATITDYAIYSVKQIVGGSESEFFNKDAPDNYFENANGVGCYFASEKPKVGESSYASELPATIGQVETYNDYYSTTGGEANPTEKQGEFEVNNTLYYSKLISDIVNTYLYPTPYPASKGQYNYAGSGNVITINGNNYTMDDLDNTKFIGEGGSLFYIVCNNVITLDDKKRDRNGNIIANSCYDDKYCTPGHEIGKIKTKTDTYIILANGTRLERYVAGDEGDMFRVLDFTDGAPVGTDDPDQLGRYTNGKRPNVTGSFGGIGTGATVKGAFRKGSWISNLRTASSRSQNYNFDASWVDKTATGGYKKITQAGSGVQYCEKV